MRLFRRRVVYTATRHTQRFNMKKQLSIALFFSFTIAVFAASFTRAAGQQSAASGQSPASEKQNARPADKLNEATKTDSTADAQHPAQRDHDDVVRISVTLAQGDEGRVDG